MYLHLTDNSKLFTPEQAEQIAAGLQENDLDGWTYKAIHDPAGKGYSYIAVCDEEGEFVGKY